MPDIVPEWVSNPQLSKRLLRAKEHRPRNDENGDNMKILIIGGTRFLGRHLVNSARARGHEVTLFNRGKTNAGLFDQIEKIQGDREKDLDQYIPPDPDEEWRYELLTKVIIK